MSIFYAFCIVERIADNQPQKHVSKYIEMFCCKNLLIGKLLFIVFFWDTQPKTGKNDYK